MYNNTTTIENFVLFALLLYALIITILLVKKSHKYKKGIKEIKDELLKARAVLKEAALRD